MNKIILFIIKFYFHILKTHKQRINNVIGQLEGISKMIDNGKEYSEVITQIKAVKSALDSILQKYSEEKLVSCLKLSCKDEENCRMFIKEIIKSI
ncbi:metal-sensing transcriptional repressor [Candidatus Dojkabacteria bacterium]|nr:metal-sensing transcriptional repressor [Candidatus Dojkabacteria bacterium]